jgi:DNA polymerase-3 subunit epsilon
MAQGQTNVYDPRMLTPWRDATFIALDLETSGKYPLDAEICEMAAVKWRAGEIVDTYQALIKPTNRMSDFVISIHNITNEMVENAPPIKDKIAEFHKFIGDGYIIAHHAPFDMGFLAWDFESAFLPLPTRPALCTSLLSRQILTNVANHRLATLAKHFNIDAGAAHRALDDAKTCLQVALKCFEKLGDEAKVKDIFDIQHTALTWDKFSISALTEKAVMANLVRALRDRAEVYLTYEGGSKPGTARRLFPLGLVRSPEGGDFLVAGDGEENSQPKRYFLEKISEVRPVTI